MRMRNVYLASMTGRHREISTSAMMKRINCQELVHTGRNSRNALITVVWEGNMEGDS